MISKHIIAHSPLSILISDSNQRKSALSLTRHGTLPLHRLCCFCSFANLFFLQLTCGCLTEIRHILSDIKLDNKTFITRLSKRLNREPAEVSTLVEGLCVVIREAGADLDSIAVPGFGTFKSSKTEERVVTDEASGERTLLPPAIALEFQPSIVLRKKLTK